MSNYFYSESRVLSYVGSAMYLEGPRNAWQGTFCWLHPRGSAVEVIQGTGKTWSDYIFDLAWSFLGVEPAELSEIVVNREVFRVFLGLLLPLSLPRPKAGIKMIEMLQRVVGIKVKIFFSVRLFSINGFVQAKGAVTGWRVVELNYCFFSILFVTMFARIGDTDG